MPNGIHSTKLIQLCNELSAAEWGDMQAFLWKGRLRIIAQGKKCSIRLEDSATGKAWKDRQRQNMRWLAVFNKF
jgi:hypothetical protein